MKIQASSLTFFLLLSFLAYQTNAQTLYGLDNSGQIHSINTANGASNLECVLPTGPMSGTELENNPDGTYTVQQVNGLFTASIVTDITACTEGPPVMNAHAFNGLEWVGNTLYGAGIDAGGGVAPSSLYTLDPVTGVSVPIGLTGIGPITGLAYNPANGTMYGTGRPPGLPPSIASLYTINLGSGVATPVGNTGRVLGSLEFGPNGVLYAGGGQTDAGMLFSINPADGSATLIGDTGIGLPITGLAFSPAPAIVPTLSQWMIIILGLILMIFGTVALNQRTTQLAV